MLIHFNMAGMQFKFGDFFKEIPCFNLEPEFRYLSVLQNKKIKSAKFNGKKYYWVRGKKYIHINGTDYINVYVQMHDGTIKIFEICVGDSFYRNAYPQSRTAVPDDVFHFLNLLNNDN